MDEGCLTPEEIDGMLDGRMSVDTLARAEEHIDGCASCRIVVGNAAREGLSAATEVEGQSPVRHASRRAIPRHIGRYEVVEKLGAGGMGVVMLAEDADLKRKVVIKLLRPELIEPGSDARERLLREAQAMAKVSHVNVVPIYDVGVHDGKVFLAMEYVDGGDLAAWIAKPRTVAEILDVFVQAGRGLVAAHSAGLVHRDFKPHNVLIGKSGEVKVTDFGLARTALSPLAGKRLDRTRPRVSTANNDLSVATLLDSPLTQSGAMVGTPAYMAPEQILAEHVDARSDQFSFCVALYEALYGQRPFQGLSTADLFEATLSGRFTDVPTDRRIPARVREAVRRGLSVEPSDRFPTMHALLAALVPRRRRAWVAIGAAGLVAVAGITMAFARGGSEDPCIGLEGGLKGAWDADIATRMKARFVAANAGPAFESVAATFERYEKAWTAMRVDTCKATRVRGDQKEDVRVRRSACLEERKAELGTLTKRLTDDTAFPIDRAARVSTMLIPPSTCTSVGAAAAASIDRNAPDVREVEAELRSLNIDVVFSANDHLRDRIDKLVARVDQIPYPSLQADSHMLAATVAGSYGDTAKAETELRTALRIAELGQYDHGRARAMLQLANLQLGRGDVSGASTSIDSADATLARIGGDPSLALQLEEARATLLRKQGKSKEALALLERVVGEHAKLHGDDDIMLASLLVVLATAYFENGRVEDGKRANERSNAILSKNFPDSNGITIIKLVEQQQQAFMGGDMRGAIELAQRVLAMMQSNAGGFPEQWIGSQHSMIGTAHMLLEEHTAARDAYLKGAATYETLKMVDMQGFCLESAGRSELELKHHEAALALFRKSVEISPPDSDQRLTGRQAIGRALAILGPVDEAIAELEWVLPRLEAKQPLQLGIVGNTRLALADALWQRARPGDRDRARATAKLARETLHTFRRELDDDKSGLKAIQIRVADRNLGRADAWIAAHK